jgi:ATP-dependent DNA helicase RecG
MGCGIMSRYRNELNGIALNIGPETETLEYKRSTGETNEALCDISAILDKHGKGEVYFGILPSGEIKGQQVSTKTLNDLSKSIGSHIEPKIYPSITKVRLNSKDCVKVEFEGAEPPYKARGKYYKRVSDESLEMSTAELRRYFKRLEETHSPWDTMPAGIGYDEIDEGAVRTFVEKANDEERISWGFNGVENAMRKLKLVVDGKLVNAAKVLFGKEPGLSLKMAVFATDVKVTFNDIRIEEGNVSELVDAAETYIKNTIHWRVEFTGKRKRDEIPEIPVEAIREALNNSYCHRLFPSTQNNEVLIFKNRIEIYNPGTFPEGLTPKAFIDEKEPPVHRNPLLASTMYLTKDAETFGTGLKRIHDYCSQAGVKYEFKLRKYGFAVIFYRPKEATEDKLNIRTNSGQSLPETYTEETFGKDFGKASGLTAAQKEILRLIATSPVITIPMIAEQLGKSSRAIEYQISKLKQARVLEREGGRKEGHWVIKESDEAR